MKIKYNCKDVESSFLYSYSTVLLICCMTFTRKYQVTGQTFITSSRILNSMSPGSSVGRALGF